jgi:hypothetical protein
MGKIDPSDFIGKQFGRWTVLERSEDGKGGNVRWLCRCECGTERAVVERSLRKGVSRSCGCLARELARGTVIDLAGQVFGRLKVLARAENDKHGEARWLCKCECGNDTERVVAGSCLRDGQTRSCGCLNRELASARAKEQGTHGHTKTGRPSRTYKSWLGMLARCCNQSHKYYHRYGGRGITVIDRWKSFECFLSDMKERPPGLTLERKNNALGYNPQNCVWSDMRAQSRNKNNNRWLEFNGERMVLQDWADRLGTHQQTIHLRLKRGWDLEKSLTYPVQIKRRNPTSTKRTQNAISAPSCPVQASGR